MGWFFKKKQQANIEQPSQRSVNTNRYDARTNGMVTQCTNVSGDTYDIVIKYVLGERKYFMEHRVNLHKDNTTEEDINVGSLLSILYDSSKPEKAIVENFQEL